MEINFSKFDNKTPLAVILLDEDGKLIEPCALPNEHHEHLLGLLKLNSIKIKPGTAVALGRDKNYPEIMWAGFCVGKIAELDEQKIIELGGKLYAELTKFHAQSTNIITAQLGNLSQEQVAACIAKGASLRSYKFDKYRTKKKDDETAFGIANIVAANPIKAEQSYADYKPLIEGVFLARDLISEPPNVLYPSSYAERCKELKKLGVKVEVLGVSEMTKLGMGALLGVGQGSSRESKLVVMEWRGDSNAKNAPIAIVGKGVCFDTGGISIKPSNGMEDMKYDMAGSAAVVGAMHSLAASKAKVNVVGVVGLVENMPDGNAQRPSDVVTSMSGQTIEVLNTDAEGRLVLADALWYTQDKFQPKAMIDLATLTGAIVITLASVHAGLFSNNDALANQLSEAGNKVNEPLWRLPITADHHKMIESKIADVQNISNERGAGSITAAAFLEKFVNNVPWAHLDIAGMAWNSKARDLSPAGAAGFGVRLLHSFINDNY